MYEIRSKDGKMMIVYDTDTGEYFPLPTGAKYKGKKAVPYRTNDVYSITSLWNMFGGSYGDYEMEKVK